MSLAPIVDVAEAAAAVGTPWGWLRLGLKALPWAVIAVLGVALLMTRATLDHVQMQAKLDVGAAQLASAQHDLVQAGRTNAALQHDADRWAAREPIVLRSTDTVTRYASTDEGRAACLPPDRLRGVQQDRDALFAVDPAGAAGRGAPPMPADPAPAAAGRVGDAQRR